MHTPPAMKEPTLVIVGGGLAGLAAGCYARASGYRTTVVEHGLALGGVCTAWQRDPYTVDGCIHWLTGGAFARVYEELGIVPRVPLRVLERWVTWRDVRDRSTSVTVTRDLDLLARDLKQLDGVTEEDARELDRLVASAAAVTELDPGVARPPEITPLREQLRALWEMRSAVGTLAHYRKPVGQWTAEHLTSEPLRRFFSRVMPAEAPAMMLLLVLGYMKRGWLSRPVGGTRAFRDALIEEYERLGGRSMLHATVDEILVEGDRARGVRLEDGTLLEADAVVCTSSMPETVLRLLGGRYGAEPTRERMARWKMFEPIVLASFGVDVPLRDLPPMLLVDGLPPYDIGGATNEHLYLRICNDDPSFAPPGHTVVQAMLATDYGWWATRGTAYEQAKEEVARIALAQIARYAIPGLGDHVKMTDVATPLTYWRETRSWRGAYEGWHPNTSSLFGHVSKKLPGLAGFVMAGQWVEPGGGVPTAVTSGRQAVQILCDDDGRDFAIPSRG